MTRKWYLLNCEIYVGKQNDGQYKVSNATIDITMRLSQPVHGSGRNLTMDNWFISFALALKLLKSNTTFLGTVKNNKKDLPPEFISKRKTEKLSMFAYQKDKYG